MKDYHYYHYYWQDCMGDRNNSQGNCTREMNPKLFSEYYYFDYELNKIPPNVTQFFMPCFFAVAFLFGFVGNILIMVSVCRNKKMQTITNFYFLNLAVADLVFLVFCVPYTATIYALEFWPFGESMCKLTNFLMIVTMDTSIATLTAMTIDKYYTITYPIRAKVFRTVSLTVIVVILIWAGSLLLLLPVIFVTTTVPFWREGVEVEACTEIWGIERHRQTYTLIVFLATYVLPLTIVIVFYGKMWKQLWPSSVSHRSCPSGVTEGQGQGAQVKAMQARRRDGKAVLMILVVFFVAWLPAHCIQINSDFGVQTDNVTVAKVLNAVTVMGHCLTYICSSIKPCILVIFCKNFRKVTKKMLLCDTEASSAACGDTPAWTAENPARTCREDSFQLSAHSRSFPEAGSTQITSIAEDVAIESDDPEPIEV